PAIFAPIPAAAIRPSPALWPAAGSRLRGAELEIAFRIDAPLPPADAADFLPRLAAAVTPLPAFEILDSRLQDPRNAAPLRVLADSQMNAGLVCGAASDGRWQPADFDRPDVFLKAGDSVLCAGPASLPGGTPFALLAELVCRCGDHCGGLQPGQIVTTGSFTGMHFFAAGATVSGRIAGLTPLSVTFAD
ncbi:hypothetical protein, partial [Ferrovibrio sp.]|uniref:hypothetical protein n=1 Tax=Ferrovibrio sp. TaxID=1917215 RepID=UPI00311E6B59